MEAAIEIRPLGRGDQSAFSRFFERLSMQSRYLRFFAPMPRLPKRTLDWLVDVDGHRHSAIAAWYGDELIGEARYVAVADATAEIAITIRDDWQRRGVGLPSHRYLAPGEPRGAQALDRQRVRLGWGRRRDVRVGAKFLSMWAARSGRSGVTPFACAATAAARDSAASARAHTAVSFRGIAHARLYASTT